VELLCATQALDFRAPLKPGKGVHVAHEMLRRQTAHAQQDYEIRNDLDLCANILRSGELALAVEAQIGPLA
jgi:histidine ammonia-lyase